MVSYGGNQAFLQWFNRETLILSGQEMCSLGEDGESLIKDLEITLPLRAHQGWFFISESWKKTLQPYFEQRIETETYDFFVAFPTGQCGHNARRYL